MLMFGKHAKGLRLLLAFSAGALAVASMMAGAMSLALFTDQQTVNNSFTAGTIVLNGPRHHVALAVVRGTSCPVTRRTAPSTVQNDGTAQLRYAVSATSTNTDTKNLRSVLTLTVKTMGTNCATFDGTQLFTGTLGASTAIIGTPGTGCRHAATATWPRRPTKSSASACSFRRHGQRLPGRGHHDDVHVRRGADRQQPVALALPLA